jgi:hypothetical protein
MGEEDGVVVLVPVNGWDEISLNEVFLQALIFQKNFEDFCIRGGM